MNRSLNFTDAVLGLGNKVYLRKPDFADEDEFVENIIRSRQFHYPWIVHKVNVSFFSGYLLRFENNSEGHLVCLRKSHAIVGAININDIVRGALQCGYLGFYAFVQYAGLGYMSEGLKLVIERSFQSLQLHRLEANIQPRNIPSKNFVMRHGFKQEGYSRRYLKVAGRWKDHERWALLKDEWLQHEKNTD